MLVNVAIQRGQRGFIVAHVVCPSAQLACGKSKLPSYRHHPIIVSQISSAEGCAVQPRARSIQGAVASSCSRYTHDLESAILAAQETRVVGCGMDAYGWRVRVTRTRS